MSQCASDKNDVMSCYSRRACHLVYHYTPAFPSPTNWLAGQRQLTCWRLRDISGMVNMANKHYLLNFRLQVDIFRFVALCVVLRICHCTNASYLVTQILPVSCQYQYRWSRLHGKTHLRNELCVRTLLTQPNHFRPHRLCTSSQNI